MKAAQIIYTSCRRGITGDTSGFQTYSYSQQIEQWEKSNQLGVIFAQYNGSTMPLGLPVLPTPEEASALFPKRYSYRRIEGNDKLCAAALCTYIGKDYPEDSQRSGNFLGHGLVFSEEECDINPGLLIGSQCFISSIDPELVRKDERPEMLPDVQMLPSETISIDAVSGFLCDCDRAEEYKQMLKCLLNSKDERLGRVRRIFIHDSPENIRLWIASLMLAFPVKSALNISYSTYEFDPENSNAHIVGVSKDTNYNTSKSSMGIDCYFDFIDNIIDNSEFDDIEEYCEFVCDSLMYSYENLQVFHDFLNKISYFASDKTIADAHNLSLVSQGVLTIDDFGVSPISRILEFALKYAGRNINADLSGKLYTYMLNASFSEDVFSSIFEYLKSLLSSGIVEKSAAIRELAGVCTEHFCLAVSQQDGFDRLFSLCKETTDGELCSAFLSQMEDVDVKAWCKPDLPWKPAFIVMLYAPFSESVREFIDKESRNNYILENLLSMTAVDGADVSGRIIHEIFSEYKKAGVEAATVLYLSIRRSSTAQTDKSAITKWIIEFRSQLAEFSEINKIKALQVLHKYGFDDDIQYAIDLSAKGTSDDFLSFVQLLEEHIPDYFSVHRQEIASAFHKISNTLPSRYNFFVFAVKTKKYSNPELADMLEKISDSLIITGELEPQRQYIDGLCDYCDALGVGTYPHRISLAALSLHLNDLCKQSSKLFSSDKKLMNSINNVMQSSLPGVEGLDNETAAKYLSEIAGYVAVLTLSSAIYALQDEILSLNTQMRLQFKYRVLKHACAVVKKSHAYEPLICLIIYDTFAINNISNSILEVLNKSGISPSALRKCTEKEKSMEVIDRYYNSLNITQAVTSTTFLNRLIDSIEPERGGFIGGVLDLFSKNKKG